MTLLMSCNCLKTVQLFFDSEQTTLSSKAIEHCYDTLAITTCIGPLKTGRRCLLAGLVFSRLVVVEFAHCVCMGRWNRDLGSSFKFATPVLRLLLSCNPAPVLFHVKEAVINC